MLTEKLVVTKLELDVVVEEVVVAVTTCNNLPTPAPPCSAIVPVEAGTVTVNALAVFVGTSSMLPPLAAANLTPMFTLLLALLP